MLNIGVKAGNNNSGPADSQNAGVISSLLPNAELVRSSGSTKVRFGAALIWNDTLRTDANGRLRARLDDQTILLLAPNSEIKIASQERRSERTSIQLDHGVLRIVAKNLAARFEVRTPTAVATVYATEFGVDASDPGVVKFFCVDGDVEVAGVAPASAGTVHCRAGNTVTVEVGRSPEYPLPFNVTDVGIWRNVTDPEAPPPFEPRP